MTPRITVVGDALLDRDLDGTATRLAPDAPVPVVEEPARTTRPGGAALAAVLAARNGARATLVTATGDDQAGVELRACVRDAGVQLIDIGHTGSTAEKVRVRASGRPLLRMDRGCARPGIGDLTAEARQAVLGADAVLVADYGRGMTSHGRVRQVLQQAAARIPLVWDPHPRGAPPVCGVAVATPNAAEAAHFLDAGAEPRPAAAAMAQTLRERWAAHAVLVTLGAQGAVLARSAELPLAIATTPASGDCCGAGDCLAATLTAELGAAQPLDSAAQRAVRAASAFVAAGGAAAMHAAAPALHEVLDATALAQRIRARGGTVVATGGCFDLLHAGHLTVLDAARRMGDCLIVCMNSDSSVRRLKGPGRPLVVEDDRAAVLEALRCVDAVAIFDEPTPDAVLRRIRPHLWVKGGDYSLDSMPEREVLQEWGGEAIVVPYLRGRSTTRLVALARRSA